MFRGWGKGEKSRVVDLGTTATHAVWRYPAKREVVGKQLPHCLLFGETGRLILQLCGI